MKRIFYIELDEDYVPIFKVCGITAPFSEFKEQITCKDCKYWQDNNGGYPNPNCKWNAEETPDADDYCSGAESKYYPDFLPTYEVVFKRNEE